MFARSVFRTARASAPLKRGARSYASEAGQSSGPGGLVYGAVGIAALGGGYYYYTSQQQASLKAEAAGPAEKAFQGGDQGFISLKLQDAQQVNRNVKWLRFALPKENMVSGLPVASAVITKFQEQGMEKPVIRPYTPTSDEEERGHVDFIIKRYDSGPMSEHLHSLAPGQGLEIKGPIPKYPIEENKHNHIVMIAGGTGITPMWQVARNIFKNPNDKTKVTLISGNVSEEDILLKKEWDELENTYPRRFRAFYTLDDPPEQWQQGKGFITKDLLKTVMPEPKEDNIKVFVCGPPGMYKAISGAKNSPSDQGELSGILKELGYSKDQVFKF